MNEILAPLSKYCTFFVLSQLLRWRGWTILAFNHLKFCFRSNGFGLLSDVYLVLNRMNLASPD